VVGIRGIHFMTEVMLYGLEELQNNCDYTRNQARSRRDALTSGSDRCTPSSSRLGKNPTPSDGFEGTLLQMREPHTLQKLLTTCAGLRAKAVTRCEPEVMTKQDSGM
jgi:hypothetical protein